MKDTIFIKIMRDAVNIANNDPRKPSFLKGSIFRSGADPNTLSIQYNKKFVSGGVLSARAKKKTTKNQDFYYKLLDDIAYDAIYEAIHKNGNLLSGLLVNNAKRGRGFSI